MQAQQPTCKSSRTTPPLKCQARANQETQEARQTPLLNITTAANPHHGSYHWPGPAPSTSLTVTYSSSQQKKKPVHTGIKSLAQGQSQNQPIQCLHEDGKMASRPLHSLTRDMCLMVGVVWVSAFPHLLVQCTICPTVPCPIVQEAGKRQSWRLNPAHLPPK